ncbi:metallophosphoesterase [Solihabitans fulvus]|uniref:Metallophosphoesterase n=1 Tax=Solihabitans fulvus TaxID=1892852 RepID=A0A5B2XU35_9PSEU|nr:metallophosphoesterase [Solihabitans fulvus]KAA2267016.1 metallophosphoesterase [Solihabitans fulvus]
MTSARPAPGRLLATSDIHVAYAENKKIVQNMRPDSSDDWLIVAGDVSETMAEIEWALGLLAERFAKVIWAPGNHELWTPKNDPVQLRGEQRYMHMVQLCRRLGVLTPEDPFAVWEGDGGPVTIAPLFLLYDYSFRPEGTTNKEESLAYAHSTGVVCTDEYMLHPDPYPSIEAWCWARIEHTQRLLEARDPDLPTVLINHWPMVREPTRILRYPEFAQWCGTELSADWHLKYNAVASVYGHLHIPRSTVYDGVRFEEVSVGYPREWQRHNHPKGVLRQILPEVAR